MSITIALNTVWVVLAAALVLFMEGGFSLLEAGLVRTKNAVNVTMKIFVDLTFGALVFYLIGSHLLFGQDITHIIGWGQIVGPSKLPLSAFLLFQIGFAIATVSIVSGAVAERMKFSAYIIVVILTCGLIYPISSHWIWGQNGWLIWAWRISQAPQRFMQWGALWRWRWHLWWVLGTTAFTLTVASMYLRQAISHWPQQAHLYFGLDGLGLMREVH